MAKTNDYILIPYNWIKQMGSNIYDPDKIDDEVGSKRLWFFVRSVMSINEGGTQILANDPFVDASVQNYLSQFDRIKNKSKTIDNKDAKRGGLSEEEWNNIIKDKIKEGLTSKDIFNYLKKEYNISYKEDSIIRKSEPWKNRFNPGYL